MTVLTMPQAPALRAALAAAAAASLLGGSYFAVSAAGAAAVREAEFNAPAGANALRAAALENDCMNKQVTQRVKDRRVPSPRELEVLRASCGRPGRP